MTRRPGRSTCRLLGVLLGLAFQATILPGAASAHESHQTISVAEFDMRTRMLQVMIRMDAEELETYITEVTKQPVFLKDPETERLIAMMLGNSLRILNADGTIRRFRWIGVEQDDPWAYIYIEFPIPRKTHGLRLSNTVYFDHADDQENLINLEVDGAVRTLRYVQGQAWHDLDLPPGPDPVVTPIAQFKKVGQGPIQMVMLPTHCCDGSIFEAFMERNAERYTMYAVTLPGVSRTPTPPMPVPGEEFAWIENAAAATAKFIKEHELDQPVIVGHGLGGVVAYHLGAEHPEVVGPIITFEAMTAQPLSRERVAPDERRTMVDKVTGVRIQRLSDGQWDRELRILASEVRLNDEKRRVELEHLFLRTSPEVGKRYLIEHLKMDAAWTLAKIEVPMLVIGPVSNVNAGRGIMAGDVERRWRAQFENAPDNIQLTIWKDTGPFLLEEKPAELDRTIEAFLKQARRESE